MARIPQETIEEMKRSVDLVALVRGHGVELKRSGKNWKGCCPFHDDNDPSLVITPHKHLWNCLGCDAGGDAYQWVMKADKVSFRRAHEILSERYGGGAAVAANGAQTKRQSLAPAVDLGAEGQQLLRQVVDYYHERLKENPAAQDYLRSRGVADGEAIERFKIGFSDRTLGMRLPVKQIKAGKTIRNKLQQLGILRESGHEQFSGSIVVPVFDAQGNVCEIYGRKINNNLRKGTIYHTYLDGDARTTDGRGVFNLAALQAVDEVILCESIIDALTFWCAGYRNVTTSYGAKGFTDDHLAAFEQHSIKRVLIAYDNDKTGNDEAKELAAKLIERGYEVFRCRFPSGMDANEYAMKVRDGNGGAHTSLGLVIRKGHWCGKGAAPEITSKPVAAKEESSAPEQTSTEAASVEQDGNLPSLAASPVPRAAKDVDADVKDNEITIQLGNRRYRVRGLGRNLTFDQLKVNLLAAKGELVHVDTFDLYAARPRATFVKVAALELSVDEQVIKKDIGRVLLKLEELQDDQIAAATKPKDNAPKLSDDETSAGLELLKSPNLMQRILDDFDAAGVVGEQTNKLVGYLAAVSRKLDKPLAVVIQSSSSAGKSSLMDAVLKLMPTEEQIKYSAMTGQSLFYMGETSLKHKILAIAEEEGVEQAAYALKLLQSEGELTIASAGKNSDTGRLGTQEYHVEGPVMIFLTTTSSDIDEELLNRCIVLAVDEDRAQTRAIHKRQRQSQTLKGMLATREAQRITKLHADAQRLLRPLVVVNPFAEQLTFQDNKTRTRRDHMKYLSLIQSIALLHQYQRPIQKTEYAGEVVQYIEITAYDIAVANGLASVVLGRTLDELSPQTRRLLVLLHDMVVQQSKQLGVDREDYRFTRRDVREAIGWTDFQVRTHLTKLVELEYVLVHRGRRGQQFVYELLYDGQGREGQPFLMGLIDPAKISGYDKKFEGFISQFEHQAANLKPSLSIDRASIEPSLRPSKNGARRNVHKSNGHANGKAG